MAPLIVHEVLAYARVIFNASRATDTSIYMNRLAPQALWYWYASTDFKTNTFHSSVGRIDGKRGIPRHLDR
jgi:hypothetical protein